MGGQGFGLSGSLGRVWGLAGFGLKACSGL